MYSTEWDLMTVCERLKERYEGKDTQQIRFLRNDLSKVRSQAEDMSYLTSKLQILLNQLLSAGCPAYDDNDKIFPLLNSLPMEYHLFRKSIIKAESLTIEEVSSRLIRDPEMLGVGMGTSRRGGVAFYAENGKSSKGAYSRRRANRSKHTCSYCHFKGPWAKDCKKRIAWKD
jgi:hypothetical protein